MISDQGKHAWWRRLLHREAAESIDHLMACLVGLEDACCAFEPKDLLNAFPVLGKPVIEIRATGDLTVLEPSMPFVPGLGLFPTATIRGAILKQIGNVLVQGGLIVLSKQDIGPSKPMDLRTERTLGMHGIQGEDAPSDQVRGQQRLERADLIFFLLHIAMPQDDASSNLITTELMHRTRPRRRGPPGFGNDS